MYKCIISSITIGMLTLSQVLFSFPFNLPEVKEAKAATRLGLHVTQEELNCWRQRAGLDAQGSNGITCPIKYRTAQDVSTNSPGDWTRIVANKDAFASSPSTGRWTGPAVDGTGCVFYDTSGGQDPPSTFKVWTGRIRDAAFYDRVANVTTRHAAIKTELLWIAQQPNWNWANTSRWCAGAIKDRNPGFIILEEMTKLLFAYDYTPRSAWTSGELAIMDKWFWDAADFWRGDIDETSLDGVFVNRPAGNYTPYVGAPNSVQRYAKLYNNRRNTMYKFVGLAAIYLVDKSFTPASSRYSQTPAGIVVVHSM
jgi:hypothetical protein